MDYRKNLTLDDSYEINSLVKFMMIYIYYTNQKKLSLINLY